MNLALPVMAPSASVPRVPGRAPVEAHASGRLLDSHGRAIRHLRLSITDRCNFRCVYCMDPGVRFMHVFTAMSIGPDKDGETGMAKVYRERDAALDRGARFVISDLEWVALQAANPETRELMLGDPHDPARVPFPDLMPTHTPYRTLYTHEFPFYLPTVFRSSKDAPGDQRGRYIVHRVR